jgi:hypothetical protein
MNVFNCLKKLRLKENKHLIQNARLSVFYNVRSEHLLL